MSNEILIIAGEASGDMHAASLIHEIKKLRPGLSFTGIGGDKMIAEGMTALYHISQMAFLGFAEVLKHLPFIKEVRSHLIEEVKARKISTVILIDYPGFNLNLAKQLKPLGVKIIYYISPQVWAWGKGRVKKIRSLVDELIVILPFEEQFFSTHKVPVSYAGHPLIEQIKEHKFMTRAELSSAFGLDPHKEILLLLPGSRKQEVKKIFSQSLSAAIRLAREFNMQVVVACSSYIDESVFKELSGETEYTTIKGHTYDLFRHSAFGIIKSGTSTLEAGLFHLPMVVVYSTNYLTYLLGRLLVKIKMIALVNIVLGEKAVPELIQGDVNADKIYLVSRAILSDKNSYDSIRNKLLSLSSILGDGNASANAAQLIIKYI